MPKRGAAFGLLLSRDLLHRPFLSDTAENARPLEKNTALLENSPSVCYNKEELPAYSERDRGASYDEHGYRRVWARAALR